MHDPSARRPLNLTDNVGERVLARLPSALHDAAAIELGSAAYLFGSGNGTSQLDRILRIDGTGRVTAAGNLPAPGSDQVAAVVGGIEAAGFAGSRPCPLRPRMLRRPR